MLNSFFVLICLLVQTLVSCQTKSEGIFTGTIEYEERYYQEESFFVFMDSVMQVYMKEDMEDWDDDLLAEYKPLDMLSMLPKAEVFNNKTNVKLTRDSVTIIKTALDKTKDSGIEEMYPKRVRKRNFPYKPIISENYSDSLVNIEINKNIRKNILGYECYQVNLTQLSIPMPEMFNELPFHPDYVKYELWVTNELNLGADIYYPDLKENYYSVGLIMSSKSFTNIPGKHVVMEVMKVLPE